MKKIRKGQKVKFNHISGMTGSPVIHSGTVIGFGQQVRNFWPEECGEAPDNTLLIFRQDNYGNKLHYAISPDQIIKED